MQHKDITLKDIRMCLYLPFPFLFDLGGKMVNHVEVFCVPCVPHSRGPAVSMTKDDTVRTPAQNSGLRSEIYLLIAFRHFNCILPALTFHSFYWQ